MEVWVATREGGSACIEIVDVLKKVRSRSFEPLPLYCTMQATTNRIRQRFVVQQAKNVQCMKYIPGSVEQGDGEKLDDVRIVYTCRWGGWVGGR